MSRPSTDDRLTAWPRKNPHAKRNPRRNRLAPAKSATKKKPARGKKPARRTPADISNPISSPRGRGLGPGAGGQSGDNQGLSRREVADSESVEELTEEGQEYEAEVISGVENAPDPDQGEVTTKQVPEDDVPSEYDDQDQ